MRICGDDEGSSRADNKGERRPSVGDPHNNRGVLRRILVEKPEGAKMYSVLPERR